MMDDSAGVREVIICLTNNFIHFLVSKWKGLCSRERAGLDGGIVLRM